MIWDDFLRKIADDFGLSPEQTEVFLIRFREENKQKPDSEVQKLVEEVLHLDKAAYEKRRGGIYKKFEQSRQNPTGCEEIVSKSPRKAEKLLAWLEGKWSEQLPLEQAVTSSRTGLNIAIWQGVCCEVLEIQQKQWLTSHPLGAGTRKVQDVYVRLGLVERQQKPRVKQDVDGENGSIQKQEEVVTPVAHETFFDAVLTGCSPKSQGKRIAVIGEPGAGKTTLLQEIATRVEGLPIWIDLASLKREDKLEDYLLREWLKPALTITQKYIPEAVPDRTEPSAELKQVFIELFDQEQVWLLLDGADEMAAELGQPLSWIARQLAQPGWARQAKIVLTCRLNVWSADGDRLANSFDVYRNLDFEPEQVIEFIDKWFAKEANTGEALQQELKKANQRINSLVRNPLRLTLLCLTWKGLGDRLPETKAGLYQRLVEAHYQFKSDNSEFAIDPDDRDRLHQQLGELAKAALDSKESRFRLRQSFIIPFLGHHNKKNSLFFWAIKLGWLNAIGLPQVDKKDADEPVYAFLHPTFQEYFAALAVKTSDYFLKHIPHHPSRGTYRIFQQQWEESFFFWLGFDEKSINEEAKDGIIKQLINFEDQCRNFYYYRAFFLAARGIMEYRSCKYSSEIISKIIKWGFFSAKHDQQYGDILRQYITKQLIHEILPVSFDQLARIINSSPFDNLTRIELYELQKISEEYKNKFDNSIKGNVDMAEEEINNQLETFFKRFSKFYILMIQHNSLRCDIALLLGEFSYSKSFAIQTLIEIIENEIYSAEILADEVLLKAIENLEKIDPGNPKITENQLKLVSLIKNKNCDYRYRAIKLLEKIGKANGNLANELVEVLDETQDLGIYIDITKILGEICSKNTRVIDKLLKLLESCEHLDEKFWHTAQSLEKIDPGNSALIKITSKILEDFEMISYKIPFSLIERTIKGRLENQIKLIDLINFFIEELQSDFSPLETPEGVNFLESIFEDFGLYIIESLEKVLDSVQDYWNQAIIAKDLLSIQPHNQKAILTFNELLNSQDKTTRYIAADVLFYVDTDHPSAVEAISKLILEKYDVVEIFNNTRFGLTTSPKLTQALEKLLEHDDFAVCYIAAQCLIYLNPKHREAIEILIDSFYEPNEKLHFIDKLSRTDPPKDLMPNLVSRLSILLENSNLKNEFYSYKYCCEMLWNYAHSIDYQVFYEAWINPSLNQKTNSASLLTSLKKSLTENLEISQTLQVVCIDTKNFTDPENPIADIYIEMIEQGCPKASEGRPKTIADFKTYWRLDLKEMEKQVALIFYNSEQPEQGFSDRFLASFSTLGGAIVVVTDQDTHELEQVSPNHPDLVNEILRRLRRRLWER